MTYLDDILCEAKCCSATLGAKYAHELKFGELTDETKYNLLKLNGFIRTLCRNKGEVIHKRKVIPVKNVDFSDLQRQNKYLTLKHKHITVCEKEEISPCLPDSEISHIIEQVKLLCSTCNCKCN